MGVTKVQDIHRIMSQWAPPAIAWERDNVGLQCGDPEAEVRGVIVALDPTEEVIREARRRRANMVVTHHPLLFRPQRSITPVGTEGRCLASLLRHGIALYSAHTNLDFARQGTSFALAEVLGLQDIEFLERPYHILRKIVTFVPREHVDQVASAMAEAGAGIIGNYDHCSFRLEGTGTFRGNAVARPVIGTRGRLERTPEVRLEMIAPQWAVERVLQALRRAHPYEEVAHDIYALENASDDFGMGVTGILPHPLQLSTFLSRIKRRLGTGRVRWTGDPRAIVKRIAACGGSGGELLESAIKSGADVFVTADLKYHSFHDARGRIALVDAGHHETEQPVVSVVVKKLQQELLRRGSTIAVRAAVCSTNPVRYV
jgi:dinuclear metal center YbgI/SA1388 family protein